MESRSKVPDVETREELQDTTPIAADKKPNLHVAGIYWLGRSPRAEGRRRIQRVAQEISKSTREQHHKILMLGNEEVSNRGIRN